MEETQTKTKRFSLSKEAKEKIQNIHSVLGILALQREGLNNSMMLELARVRQTLSIEDKGPEGYARQVTFDPATYEMIVTDFPKPQEQIDAEKEVATPTPTSETDPDPKPQETPANEGEQFLPE